MTRAAQRNNAQRELPFQNYIMISYENCGGRARKWASEWQSGRQDLICSLPGMGVHLIEVKHEPKFGPGHPITNPLTMKQQVDARSWIKAGGLVVAAIVGGSTKAVGSVLYYFSPLSPVFNTSDSHVSAPYVMGKGFDVRQMMDTLLTRAQQ